MDNTIFMVADQSPGISFWTPPSGTSLAICTIGKDRSVPSHFLPPAEKVFKQQFAEPFWHLLRENLTPCLVSQITKNGGTVFISRSANCFKEVLTSDFHLWREDELPHPTLDSTVAICWVSCTISTKKTTYPEWWLWGSTAWASNPWFLQISSSVCLHPCRSATLASPFTDETLLLLGVLLQGHRA